MSNPDIAPTTSSNNDQNLNEDLSNNTVQQNLNVEQNIDNKCLKNTCCDKNITHNDQTSDNSTTDTTDSTDNTINSSETNDTTNTTDNQRISPNILINNLRSIFNESKDKFSCDQIQDVMNLLSDLDQELYLLQSNNSIFNKHTNLMNLINQNVHTIVDKLAETKLTQQNVVCENGVCSLQTNSSNSKQFVQPDSENIDTMAEKISTMVVQKLQELEEEPTE
tara:strand:+ start:56 stop:721 length:666 start_codon:yes stop_codon:yes gene_type:complete